MSRAILHDRLQATSHCRAVCARLVLASLMLLCLAGCVRTYEQGRPVVKVDEAVQNRVAAAMEYLQLGQPREARQHLARALSLNDESVIAHNAMALLYQYEGDDEREEHHYRQALRSDSRFSPARNNYGTLLFRQGRYEEAIEQFERAANDPDYGGRGLAYENMGRCYIAMGREDDAISAFNRAIRLNSAALRPFLELASLHMKNGNERVADNYYQQYLARGGEQNARALWLGIRISAATGNEDDMASYELALRQRFPDSREFREYREWRGVRGGS